MVSTFVLITTAGILLSVLIYKFFIHPGFLSPLARIPAAHWSSPLSPLWILYHRQQQNDTPTVHAAHVRLGPIIRLAPNEISVNSVDGGIRTIYAGGFEKGDWYANAFANYGVPPMFAMKDHAAHSQRKRMLSNVYAKSTLQASAALHRTTEILITDRLIPTLDRERRAGRPVEIYDVLASATLDFVCAYIFGLKNSKDFIRNPSTAVPFFRDFKARQVYTFWFQELPTFTAWAFRLGLGSLFVPSWVTDSNSVIEDWLLSMCDAAEATLLSPSPVAAPEDFPTVYAQLRGALSSSPPPHSSPFSPSSPLPPLSPAARTDLASELLDHTLAGYDTSSVTLVWLARELSLPENRKWQLRLRTELRALGPDLLDPKLLDAQPVCHAVLMESLRLHAAIPGNQPRVTPGNATLGTGEGGKVTGLPAGVRVQAQAWSLHRHPEVFAEPDRWDPERWLGATDERGMREMRRWFWAFGSGGRMCVGSNLAMWDMKACIAGIWGTFGTEIVDDEGMRHNGGYIAEPRGVGPEENKGMGKRFCLLRLTKIEDQEGKGE